MRLVGVSGSLRRASHNRSLLRAAAERLPPDVQFEVWDGLAAIPAYDEDLDCDEGPEPVAAMRRVFTEADAVLISTPEYNSSIPGALKNALDWASRPFPGNCLRDKPVAVIGTSTGLFGAVWSQAETRKVLKAIGANVLEEELPVGQADSAFDEDGRLIDQDQQELLREILRSLIREVHAPVEEAQAA